MILIILVSLILSLKQQPAAPPPDFPLPLLIFIIVLGATTLGWLFYITYKKIKSQHRTKLEKFLNKCTDISLINDIIVIDTKSGIDIFSQSFRGRKLDNKLISEFLKATMNFELNLSEAAKESRTLNIVFKDSIIMQTEFINLKLIITLTEHPSAKFKFIMEDLAYDIYKFYGQEIDNFTGILKPFQNMAGLIEKHLNTSFLYRLKILENPKIKLSKSEKDMVEKARTFMKENNFKHFYSLYSKSENSFTPKDRDDDDLFFPYPYIFNPPKPPDDLAGAAQGQLRKPLKEEDSEEVNCQYCGMSFSKEDQFNHSCKKKAE